MKMPMSLTGQGHVKKPSWWSRERQMRQTECKGGTVGSLRFYPGAILEGLWWKES